MGERQFDDLAEPAASRGRPVRPKASAATLSCSPRAARRANSGSDITASPIHCGAMTSERLTRPKRQCAWTFSPAFRR